MADITIYTLAEELNMTPSMVSRAFNPNGKISEEKRKIVLNAAKKYDFSPNRFASRLSMKTVRLGILISSVFPVNTEKMLMGINSAYEKLKDYKITYEIKILNPNETDLAGYKKVLLKYKNYDGVILTGMSSPKYAAMINELYSINPNIVQVQSINENVNYLFGSKHNEKTASGLAADFLHNCLKRSNSKNIILFTGNMESTLHQYAEKAFKDECERTGLNLLESIDMKDSEDYLTKILPDIFKRHKDRIDGIYITSGFSTPLCKYLEENKTDVPFVAFDTYDDIKTYIEKGIISATIAQNVAQQMETAFGMLVNYLITGEKPEKIIYTDVQVVLKSNINQF